MNSCDLIDKGCVNGKTGDSTKNNVFEQNKMVSNLSWLLKKSAYNPD